MHVALDDIALVVFDFDGTLIDSAPDLAQAVDKTLAEHGCAPAGIDKVLRWVGNGSRKLVERAFADATTDGRVDLEAAQEAFLRHYAAAPCEHTVCYAGARESLQALRDRGLDLMLRLQPRRADQRERAGSYRRSPHRTPIATCFRLSHDSRKKESSVSIPADRTANGPWTADLPVMKAVHAGCHAIDEMGNLAVFAGLAWSAIPVDDPT